MPQDTPPIPPLPSPSGSSDTPGTMELADELMKGFAPAPPSAPAPDPTPTPAPSPTPAPAKPSAPPPKGQPTPTPKDAPPKPTPTPAPPRDLDPDDVKLTAADLRKELKRMKETQGTTLREKEKAISELNEKIGQFEKRRYWSDDDLRQHEAATKRLSTLESELYSRDYVVSPEYKTKFQDRLDQIWSQAKEEGRGLTVRYMDGMKEGEDGKQEPVWKERPATEQDLLSVIDAPIGQRIQIAKKLFGDEKEAVLQWARDVESVRKEADRAIKEKREGYASEMTKRNQQFVEANQKIGNFVQQTTTHLENNYPQIFKAAADQPEAAEKLKQGFSFVDETTQKMMSFDINTRAARAAVVRSMAGAFPRLVWDNSRKDSRIAELEAELAQYNRTDPSELGGNGGGGGGGRGPGSEAEGGSDSMADEIEKLNKR